MLACPPVVFGKSGGCFLPAIFHHVATHVARPRVSWAGLVFHFDEEILQFHLELFHAGSVPRCLVPQLLKSLQHAKLIHDDVVVVLRISAAQCHQVGLLWLCQSYPLTCVAYSPQRSKTYTESCDLFCFVRQFNVTPTFVSLVVRELCHCDWGQHLDRVARLLGVARIHHLCVLLRVFLFLKDDRSVHSGSEGSKV